MRELRVQMIKKKKIKFNLFNEIDFVKIPSEEEALKFMQDQMMYYCVENYDCHYKDKDTWHYYTLVSTHCCKNCCKEEVLKLVPVDELIYHLDSDLNIAREKKNKIVKELDLEDYKCSCGEAGIFVTEEFTSGELKVILQVGDKREPCFISEEFVKHIVSLFEKNKIPDLKETINSIKEYAEKIND